LAISYAKFVGDFGLFFPLCCGASKAKASQFSPTSKATKYFSPHIYPWSNFYRMDGPPPVGPSGLGWVGVAGRKKRERKPRERKIEAKNFLPKKILG